MVRQIHEYTPNVKLVLNLRNPADRAFSGFIMCTRREEAAEGFSEELTVNIYREDILKLEDLLGRDLSIWRDTN